LKQLLPANVNLLSLEPWENNAIVMRLEHIYQTDEDAVLSTVATINITVIQYKKSILLFNIFL
jgi:lysosomal alpha-mannosidase